MVWDWMWTLYAWGGLLIFWGGILAVAIVGIILGLREAWRRANGRPFRALRIAIWAIIPSWWTIAKIAPLGFAIWSIDIVSRWDAANSNQRALVAITLLVCGALASFGLVLWHEKVQESEIQTKELKER